MSDETLDQGECSQAVLSAAYPQFNVGLGTRLAIRGLRGSHGLSVSASNYSTFANLRMETANEVRPGFVLLTHRLHHAACFQHAYAEYAE